MAATIAAIANHKGGVAKTTTAHTLGVHLAEGGYTTLLVDMDSQGSLTNSCGIQEVAGRSLAEVLGAASEGTLPLPSIIRPIMSGLDLAPADIALAETQLGLISRLGREFALKDALEQVVDYYDLIIIDCPPGQGLLTVNALAAAHGVLCPTKPAAPDLAGLKLFIQKTMIPIRDKINPNLLLIGVIISFFDERKILHRGILKNLRESGWPILQCIGQSVRVEEAAGVHETILSYEPENPRAAEYRQLGYQVEKWLRNGHKTQ